MIFRSLFILVLLSSSLVALAQENRLDKLSVLQTQLDELSTIKTASDSVQILSSEVDSLKMEINRLSKELSISEDKLDDTKKSLLVCEDRDRFVSGYYIVVESFRNEENARKKVAIWRKKFPACDFDIGQNDDKSWYHIHLTKKIEQEEIGQTVKTLRSQGFEKAWGTYLK